MRLLVIIGSNRAGGVSSKVLSLIKNHVASDVTVDELWLRNYNITLCDADNACQSKDCIIQDDVPRIVDAMMDADAIVYMPVMHAYGTNSRFQAFLERVGYGYLRNRQRPLKDKLAAVVVVGRRYGHTEVFSQVVLNILLNKMILVGAGFPPIFQTQLAPDKEAELALQDTLDRLYEFFIKTKNTSEVLSQKQ